MIPALPKPSPKAAKSIPHVEKAPEDQPQAAKATSVDEADPKVTTPNGTDSGEHAEGDGQPAPAPAPAKVTPKLWTGLFSKSSTSSGTGSAQSAAQHLMNGGTTDGSGAASGASGFSKSNASSLAEALQAYQVGVADKISFLEPKGLINTGNMCYMNSVSMVYSTQSLARI